MPLVLELLSPAQRPVQVTRDLPGFWRGSYAAVRSDLRGRYPRHPWPEDPASASADAPRQPRRDSNAARHVRATLEFPLTLRSSFSPKWQPRPPPLVAVWRLDVVISAVP